jgi:hypothetical protein
VADDKTVKPSVLGRSLRLLNGDLDLIGDDFTAVADEDNFIQALQVMIETPMGSDIFNVSYGFDLLNSISAPQPPSFVKDLIRLNIVKSLSLDDRVKEIKEIAFSDEPRFFEINPGFDPEETRRAIKRSRSWQAVIVVQTITEGDVALSLEGRGLTS